jgi:hypothetical protein
VPSARRTRPSKTNSTTISPTVVIRGAILRRRRLYWDWPDRTGNQPGKTCKDQTQELAIGADPHCRLSNRERDQLGIGGLPGRSGARNRRRLRENASCDYEGLQRCCSS